MTIRSLTGLGSEGSRLSGVEGLRGVRFCKGFWMRGFTGSERL